MIEQSPTRSRKFWPFWEETSTFGARSNPLPLPSIDSSSDTTLGIVAFISNIGSYIDQQVDTLVALFSLLIASFSFPEEIFQCPFRGKSPCP